MVFLVFTLDAELEPIRHPNMLIHFFVFVFFTQTETGPDLPHGPTNMAKGARNFF